MAGLLRIRGSIDLDQFWPYGDSDADTTKVKVTVGRSSFAFAADGKTFKTTRVFANAFVVGAKKGPVIDAKSRVVVRLQGIDAPELHYRAGALSRKRTSVTDAQRKTYNTENRHERRQFWAESATVALFARLGTLGGGSLRCEVTSCVEHPYEVVDTYGRIVGNIRVGRKFEIDINTWLAEQGWAFPAFYSSMSADEIAGLLDAAAKGRQKGRIWSTLSADTSRFKRDLVYREHGPFDEAADQGLVILPKLFRRQVAYRMERHAKVFAGNFAAFLKARPDDCFLTDEFLAQGPNSAPIHRLHHFMSGRRFTRQPQDVVFREKFSSLVDAAGQRLERF
jgi:endonuclease YncB( thermonuclease family)